MSAFKAYDIRGEVGTGLTEALAHDVGRALVDELRAARIAVGRDMRPHGQGLSEALIDGIRRQGADAIDLGVISTPMAYFANVQLGVDAACMVTASHNPPADNGIKVTRAGAVPMGLASGLGAVRERVAAGRFASGRPRGERTVHDIRSAYGAMLRVKSDFRGERPRVVLDMANAMGSVEAAGILDQLDAIVLYGDLDGSFPNHLANPLKTETLDDLRATVRRTGAALGAAFDGDADRLGFVDERGDMVRLDLVTGILAEDFLTAEPGAAIVHDVRTGRAVREHLARLGARPVEWCVGHAYMKAKMRELGSPFGGELAGHYYFRELATSESAALVLVRIVNRLIATGQTLSELFAPLRQYANSGELNYRVADQAAALRRLKEAHADGQVRELDGVSVACGDWWFNARASNTEPYLRLVVEAADEASMQAHCAALSALIGEAG